jgi:hypothetical protein
MNPTQAELRAELEERLHFEILLADLSARFVSVSSASIDDEIVNALGQIVETLDLDRSVLGQLVEGGKGLSTRIPGTGLDWCHCLNRQSKTYRGWRACWRAEKRFASRISTICPRKP